jgi:threonine aldolase
MQLMSKMRYIAAQFIPYLSLELWKENAGHANDMAQYLKSQLDQINIEVTRPTHVNAVFCRIPKDLKERLLPHYFFYTWDEDTDEVRLMCSFTTTHKEIDEFIGIIKSVKE